MGAVWKRRVKGLPLLWRDMTLGERILKQRINLGMTQRDVAKRSGIAQSHYCLLEQDRHVMSIVKLKKIAEALGVSCGALLD
jgi:transcriptional regulator with XRE-family HTH domain